MTAPASPPNMATADLQPMAGAPLPPADRLPTNRMALLFMVMLVTAAGNTAMQSVMPAIGTKLKIADVWVSLAYSWSALLWVITAPYWARLSDRRGRKALMNLGLWGFIISFAFCGFTLWLGLNGWFSGIVTLMIFAVFRSFYGGLGSAAPPAVQAYVAARTSRTERTQSLSVISSSFGLGTVIGPAIAPLIIIPVLGLSSPFVIFAIFGVIVLVSLRLGLPNDDPRFDARGRITSEPSSSSAAGERYRDDDDEDAADGADKADGAPAPMAMTGDGVRVHDDSAAPKAKRGDSAGALSPADVPRMKWSDPRIRPWLIAGLAGGHAQAIILGVIGFLLLDRLELRATPELAAGPTGLVLMSGAFATLLSQWGLIPYLKMGPRAATLWGVALGGAGCGMIGLSNGLNGITVGFAIASLGFGLFRPGIAAGTSLAVKRAEQGQIAGIVASMNGAAFVFAPALGVFLYTIAPVEAFALIVGICVFVLVWGRKALQLDQDLETGKAAQ